MNTGEGDPADKLRRLFMNSSRYSEGATPWAEADLNGDGNQEYLLALAVTDDPGVSAFQKGQGAALCVIYRRDGRFAVDVTDRMSDRWEVQLMAPKLQGVADFAGAGHPQVLWSRPESIATGPQPYFYFVTTWRPGSFVTLPGDMAISSTPKDRPKVLIDGTDVVLTGGSRGPMFLSPRTDRYRFVEGAFRLVDRRFTESGEDGYSRFWDGLVAEDVGRLADAEQAYRSAMDPGRAPHSGLVPRYHNFPAQLTPEEVAAFGEALRAVARFRLGALLLASGRQPEARSDDGLYSGLSRVLLQAGSRDEACSAAAAWAAKNPKLLPSLNLGVADNPWTAELLCSHERLDDRVP
jgi:hypothetical protein